VDWEQCPVRASGVLSRLLASARAALSAVLDRSIRSISRCGRRNARKTGLEFQPDWLRHVWARGLDVLEIRLIGRGLATTDTGIL
jgi:hypothetical protein